MSSIGKSTSLLSVAPRLLVGDGWLIAKTHPLWVALSLFSSQRIVRVDARLRRISLSERRMWRTRRTVLDFDEVDHIEYGFDDLATSFFTTISQGRFGVEAADSAERFRVGLVLKDQRKLPLFSFVGEGSRMTGLYGTLMGDDLVDFEGAQKEESLQFVQHLKRLTGLELGPRLPRGLQERMNTRCGQCGHANVPRQRCLYCGAQLS